MMERTQDMHASGRTKTFGIPRYHAEFYPDAATRRGYEDKYEDDAMGEELGDDARIWRVMLDEGRANDAAMLQRFRDHLDVDLVFSGLFSAVVTTFVAQTSQPSKPNSGDMSVALLSELVAIQRAWATSLPVTNVHAINAATVPVADPWINRFWFLSLVFSLFAAFGAVVVRQWLQEYESDISGPPKRRALVRHYRHVGLMRWKVHLIVPILPMLLHVSLLLFFIGLILYVGQSDPTMSHGIIALTALIYLLYLGTNLMPVFLPQCPYRSPLSTGAYWAKSLIALLHTLFPASFSVQDLLVHLTQYLFDIASWVTSTVITRLPIRLKVSLSPATYMLQRGLKWLCTSARDRLSTIRMSLKTNWKAVFRTPGTYEWKAVSELSDTLIPESLASLIQASSDLSVTPLVVQATSNLPIDHACFSEYDHEDPRYYGLLRDRVLPWFINTLTTRRTVFDWAPGRRVEFQRMACSLLLAPSRDTFWEGINRHQYGLCVSLVFHALTSVLLWDRVTPAEELTLKATLLALNSRLDDMTQGSGFCKDRSLVKAAQQVYSSMAARGLRTTVIHPTVWHQILSGSPFCLRCTSHDHMNLAFILWLPPSSREERPDIELELMQWATYKCAPSCKGFVESTELTRAIQLHMVCHVIASIDIDDHDDQHRTLAMQFAEFVVTSLGYDLIESALRSIGHPAVSAAFESTFRILDSPGLPLAEFEKADEHLPETFALLLFWFLANLADAAGRWDEELTFTILNALNRHATDYCKVLTEAPASDYDEFSIGLLHHLVLFVLRTPQLAARDIIDALAASLTTHLREATDDMVWCLYLDALCAARAGTAQITSKFPDASRELHSALLSLSSTYHDMWSSELTSNLQYQLIPVAVALAIKNTHGCNALAEWVDDLPALLQSRSFGLEVMVPEDLSWYRHFASDPDKYIQLSWSERPGFLPISELVNFEEAIERMQKTDAERAAVEAQRDSHDDDAETDANDDAEGPGREHGGHEDQGDAERLQNRIIARLRAIGAWGAAPFKSTRAFLAMMPGLRQVGERDPSSSIALGDIDIDIEQIAGISVALRGDDPPAPATGLGGGQDDDDDVDLAVMDRSGDDLHIPARASEGGRDGAQAQDDDQGRGDERSQAEELPHVQRVHTPNSADEASALKNAEQGGRTSVRESPDAEWGGAQDNDGEHGQGEKVPHPQHSWTPEELEGVGAREDTEHGGRTTVRENPDAGRGSAQENGDEQRRDGEHGWDGDRDRDGERALEDERSQNDKRSQAEEVPRIQLGKTPEKVEGIGAREVAELGDNTSALGTPDADHTGEQVQDDEQGRAGEHGQHDAHGRDDAQDRDDERGQTEEVTRPRRSGQTRDMGDGAGAREGAGNEEEH